ncbi:MAG: gliding motility-associated C-terminal domain-containing protein [Microscillaceae bacterium]|nr:gliding motility-associated C-terminal domain-containing protein [Microscillaceae bacterium]
MQKILGKISSGLLSIVFLLTFWQQTAWATHIRAGEIIARRIGTFRYEFTIVMYTDNAPGNADSPDLDINFGDGSPVVNVPRVESESGPIGRPADFTQINVYRTTHTFPANGAFVVSFVEENRNAGILNVNNGNSVNIPFSVSTTVVIDPGIGLNSSPILTVDPLDRGCIGQKFFHNPGAYDPDGDSLSFEFTVPRASASDPVPNYLSAADSTFGGFQENLTGTRALITIDPRTGQIEWNTPGRAGEYNLAFVVREWRNGVPIGAVVRDMQIIILDCDNKRPSLTVPPEVCATANEDPSDPSNIIEEIITATDPDGNLLIISSTDSTPALNSGVYDPDNFNVPAQFFFSPSPQASPATATFRWVTGCEHVREEPYIVVFRAEDIPANPLEPRLVDLKPMLITVKGPPPTGLVAALDTDTRSVTLNWNPYLNECPSCAGKIDDMEIIIWRREGCIDSIFCEQTPTMVGYEEIGRVSATTNSFIDNGPLALGLSYSYIISVNFPAPGGGVSRASDEQCVTLPLDAPLVTKVSVESTDANNGTIDVNWLRPRPEEADLSTIFNPPFRYELYRATGLSSASFTLIDTQIDNVGTQLSFNFTDAGLNTENNPYLYKVEWYSDAGTASESKRISSDSASSVRLSATGGENQIMLEWEYNVPWSNLTNTSQGVYRHLIYRRTANVPDFTLIDSVLVGTPEYIDRGKFNNQCLNPDSTYFYFVVTRGSYFNDQIPVKVLENKSQIDSASPTDNTPPDPPALELEANNCSFLNDKICKDPLDASNNADENTVFWTPVRSLLSCDDIAYYKLYFKGIGEADFNLNAPIYQGSDTFFVHQDLPELPSGLVSRAGCYRVVAVDLVGNESELSNEACQDNCLYYELPNVFTPNGDGINDLFRPCPSPLSVESVEIEIFNRWGNKVFSLNDNIDLNWDGTSKDGKALSTGVYFYNAKVKFFSIDPNTALQEIRGWVEIIREKNGEIR